jgi:hypothetical protein
MRFTADYEPIAQGIYQMLLDMESKGDDTYLSALAFGMLPAPLMEMAENSFVDKMCQKTIELGIPKNRATKVFRESQEGKDLIHNFVHGLSCALLHVAKENNILRV